MSFRDPNVDKRESIELGGELSEIVLKTENLETLVKAIKMMAENARERLKRAVEMAEH